MKYLFLLLFSLSCTNLFCQAIVPPNIAQINIPSGFTCQAYGLDNLKADLRISSMLRYYHNLPDSLVFASAMVSISRKRGCASGIVVLRDSFPASYIKAFEDNPGEYTSNVYTILFTGPSGTVYQLDEQLELQSGTLQPPKYTFDVSQFPPFQKNKALTKGRVITTTLQTVGLEKNIEKTFAGTIVNTSDFPCGASSYVLTFDVKYQGQQMFDKPTFRLSSLPRP